jgi:PAS domain S-box-containing protein
VPSPTAPPGVPRLLDPGTWDGTNAARVTFRLALVATAVAAAFEVLLVVVGGLLLADHLVIGGLIAGSAVATVLATRGRARASATVMIGTLWAAAVASLVVHGVRATALPTLTVSVVLAALWGGARLAVALIAVSGVVLLLVSGAFGMLPFLPAPTPVDPVADMVVIVGQFVFIATLIAFMARAIGRVRTQLREQVEEISRATAELSAIRTEKAATEARYAELVQALPDTVFVIDPQGFVLEVNEAIRTVTGQDPSFFVGKRLGTMGLLDPEAVALIGTALARTLAGEAVPPITLPIRNRDGGVRWFEATTRVMHAASGEPRILAIARDISERRRAEQSRRVLAQAIEGAQGAMCLADVDGLLTFVNPAFLRMWRYDDAAQCLGRSALEFWHEPDAALAVLEQVRDGRRTVSGMLTGRRADGTTFESEVSASIVLDEDGRFIGMMGSFVDVTARVAAERALFERESQLRRASRIARLGGWEVDLETGVLTWDDEVKRIHEVSPDFVPDVATAIDFYAPESRAEIQAAFEHLVATGEGYSLELWVVTASGRRIRVRAQGEAERRDGRVVKAFGIFQDITEQYQAAERLRAAEERNRILIESSSDLIVLLGADGTILFESPASERILGLPPEAFVGRNVLDWLHPDDVPEAEAAFATLVSGPDTEVTSLLRYRHADGSWRRLETVGRNLLHVPGVQAIFAMGRDVTEREKYEERLREAQKLESLGRLAGGVAHDFNNLLTAILGYAEEIAADQPPGSAIAQDAEEILRAAGRARDLTKQLLAFARRQVVLPRVLEVREQLDGMSRFLSRLLGEDVRLVIDVAADAGAVRMDASHFEQVFVNLAANARDAMPEGGTLTVVARAVTLDGAAAETHGLPPGCYVRFEVRDAGEGMSPEVAARIFEPFFTTKELGKGTGLGLATVYGIVRQSGGQIEVASTEGVGSTFILHLPRVVAETPPPTPAAPPPPPLRGGDEEILLVEDDAAVRSFAQRILQHAGYRLTVAASATEAERLARVRGRAFDLVVTDVVMPDLNGPALVDRLVAAFGHCPVLYVSGYTEERLPDGRLGDDRAYLPKPYGRAQLLEEVRRLLDAAGPHRAEAGANGRAEPVIGRHERP